MGNASVRKFWGDDQLRVVVGVCFGVLFGFGGVFSGFDQLWMMEN